ncbi:MAG: hypothetical protein R2874_13100 [Desulfobacterales bacterium]
MLRYADEAGVLHEEEFDMVVLSVGLQVSESAIRTANLLDIALTKNNFAATTPFAPMETSRPGVFCLRHFSGSQRYSLLGHRSQRRGLRRWPVYGPRARHPDQTGGYSR